MANTTNSNLKNLFAFLAPTPGEYSVLESWDRRLQIPHVNVHRASAVCKVSHMIYHGNITVWIWTDIRWPEK